MYYEFLPFIGFMVVKQVIISIKKK